MWRAVGFQLSGICTRSYSLQWVPAWELEGKTVEVLGIPRDFDHDDKKQYEFLGILIMMAKNDRNSYHFLPS